MRIKLPMLVLSSVLAGWLASGPAAAEAPSPTPPVAGKATIGVSVAEAELVATGWRVSKLLKADVRNDKGDKIGKVDDIIVADDGKLMTAIIDVGGFLGMGGHRVAIPVRQFELTESAKNVTLPGASKEALKAMPEFKYAK